MKYHHNATFHISEEEQIVKIYQLGNVSMIKLAQAYHCKPGTISYMLNRYNISTSEEIYQEEIKPRNRKLIQFYEDGNSLEKTAKMIGLSQSVTYKILRKHELIRPLRKRFFNEQSFDNLDNESSLYWLGFIYSDGYTHRNELKFALALKDTNHLKKLAAFLGKDIQVRTNSTKCWLSVHSKPMVARLRELGIIARRNEFYRLANEIPQGLECHFIRGYLDGDGCISNREKVIFLGQLDILTWIHSCLIKYAQASPVVKPYQRKGIMEIDFGGYNQFRRIVNYLYQDATVFMERKKEIADKAKRG